MASRLTFQKVYFRKRIKHPQGAFFDSPIYLLFCPYGRINEGNLLLPSENDKITELLSKNDVYTHHINEFQ